VISQVVVRQIRLLYFSLTIATIVSQQMGITDSALRLPHLLARSLCTCRSKGIDSTE
jgi:hypothetical protein